jgi:hypothetical protein
MAIADYALDSYMGLLRPIIPAASVMAVVDENGLPVWVDGPRNGEWICALLKSLGREYWVKHGYSTVDVQQCMVADYGTLYHLALRDTEGAVFGSLMTVVVGEGNRE